MSINSHDFMRAYHTVNNPHEGTGERFEDTTYFFRYRQMMENLADCILKEPSGSVSNILFSPCSVGCEPVSFAMIAHSKGVFEAHPDLQVSAFDISEDLMALARVGSYPLEGSVFGKRTLGKFFSGVPRQYEEYFTLREVDDMVDVDDAILSRVTYLPAQDIARHEPEKPYDATVCLNLFVHIEKDQRRAVFNNLVSMTKGVVIVNDAQSLDRAYMEQVMTARGRDFMALRDDFSDVARVRPESPERVYEQLLAPKGGAGTLALRVL